MEKTYKAVIASLIVAVVVILAGCTPAAVQTAVPTVGPVEPITTPTDQGGIEPAIPVPMDSVIEALIGKAKSDLAERLSITVDDIDLLEVSTVTWSDSSLGCPQDGMAYAQVLTPGYLLRMSYDAKEYSYHAGQDSDPFYCENPSQPLPGSSSSY